MGHKSRKQDAVEESLPAQGTEKPVGDLTGDRETTDGRLDARGEPSGGAEPESGIVAESVQENVVDSGCEPLASGGEQAGEPAVAAETSLASPPAAVHRDPRLPAVGGVIIRNYKGYKLEVAVRDDGFEFDGETYSSISKVAQAITGAKAINGFVFFKLGPVPGGRHAQQGGSETQRQERRVLKLRRLIGQLRQAIAEGLKVVDEAEAPAHSTLLADGAVSEDNDLV